MDKNILEDMVSLIASGNSPSKSMADIIMDGIRSESDRKQIDKNRHKQICGNNVYFDTEDMALYLKNLSEESKFSESAYHMGFITKDGKITKKGLKFIRNNS